MEKVAVLDLGTNTFHLLIAEVSASSIKKVVAEQRHVKLGEGGINQGEIAPTAFQRGLEALLSFGKLIEEHDVNKVKAVGTSALRSAGNGLSFVEQVKRFTGIEIELIDGEKEAELIYKGVRMAINPEVSSLIMDIGGGSVEFILCDAKEILWKKSYPVGAARLMDRFHKSDPIASTEAESIRNHLDEVLSDLKQQALTYKPELLIGSAGAFESFAALVLNKSGREQQVITQSFEFDRQELLLVLEELISSTHQQRADNTLIIPVRVDMIVVAAILTRYILGELNLPGIRMSAFSLKEGLLAETIGF
ncbi:exopolyphosphatase [Pedobacter sp. SYSU D00535]|uniref:Ppx/GppA phosphatase family protein n=1 Tax=Pedobacter sp. SYSU D00535 TaxID=2810308 RepID=UPI001A97768B|nr:exopolyphosphatase [Pedobacter sp. SYSU D00535]